MWSVAAIMFVMLCGYPLLFDETDADVLAKVSLGNFPGYAADWKVLSEDAKNLSVICSRQYGIMLHCSLIDFYLCPLFTDVTTTRASALVAKGADWPRVDQQLLTLILY